MKEDVKEIIKVAEKLDWEVSIDEDCENIEFEKFSPEGQDFIIEIQDGLSLENVVKEMTIKCDNFDCSYETYLWLDNTGHGRSGAPYDMKDLYEDMENCLEMMKELRDELEKLI